MTTDSRLARRRALRGLAAATLLAGGAPGVRAQAWPSRPVSLVVPCPPGGTTDVLARALGERLAEALGQPVLIGKRPGAGATLGADQVAHAKPDGHTLLVGAIHHAIATSAYPKLPYDFREDFARVTTIAMVPNVLVINASTPARTVAERAALARKEPGRLACGSNGNGTVQHLVGTQFQQATGTQLVHVPYKGSAPMATDLLGGQIAMSFDTITPVLPHIRAGTLRARRARAGRDAAGGRAAAERRGGEDHPLARARQADGRDRRRADRRLDRGDGAAHPRRHRALREAGEGGERHGAVSGVPFVVGRAADCPGGPVALRLLKSSTIKADMATVNFSVPDDLKAAFNAAFEGQNKSAVIAGLMREAIEREQRRRTSVDAIDRILARQRDAPKVGRARIAAARRKGRP